MKKALVSVAALVATVGIVTAEPVDDTLTINEEIEITVKTDAPEHMENVDTIYSGWLFRADETRALERDCIGPVSAQINWLGPS